MLTEINNQAVEKMQENNETCDPSLSGACGGHATQNINGQKIECSVYPIRGGPCRRGEYRTDYTLNGKRISKDRLLETLTV